MGRPTAQPDVFTAIAHPRRREILALLAAEDRAVRDLVEPLGLAQSTVSEHLGELRKVGLVVSRTHGRERVYSLQVRPLGEVTDWLASLDRFWTERISLLGHVLDDLETKDQT
ncbi:ArsR/SmtB family transcription factor [Georgenia sp. Z1491]|uniref:ArsR/SmtB family transcription factor n=1 Tax=Georgenia sp. Z1491 TaxID=3416707 RepID=UPI003CEE7A27